MTIDIVCKVVDNYGDIGVAYRLARALLELDGAPAVRLIVDELSAFSRLQPGVDPDAGFQFVGGMTVLPWSGDDEACRLAVKDDPPRLIIECFACGRPEWLESLLFDSGDGAEKTIVNLEYLSAEDYADDFHRMPSITRSPSVKKHIFMPGFTGRTGGLILDGSFMDSRSRMLDPLSRAAARSRLTSLLRLDRGAAGYRWLLVFSYERDYGRIVEDMAKLSSKEPIVAIVADGRSEACFMAAYEKAGRPFIVARPPFLPQEAWDELLLSCDFAIVRGEDSLSRAALSGRPFLWHAYPQAEGHHQVKVKALLERMRPHFDSVAFLAVESAFLAFNDRLIDAPETRGNESVLELFSGDRPMEAGFRSFADGLMANGNLAAHLMTFFGDMV